MEKGPGFSQAAVGFRRRQAQGQPLPHHGADAGGNRDIARDVAKELAQRGFKFCGPTIVYAFMQAVGMVNDHLITCHRHDGLPEVMAARDRSRSNRSLDSGAERSEEPGMTVSRSRRGGAPR